MHIPTVDDQGAVFPAVKNCASSLSDLFGLWRRHQEVLVLLLLEVDQAAALLLLPEQGGHLALQTAQLVCGAEPGGQGAQLGRRSGAQGSQVVPDRLPADGTHHLRAGSATVSVGSNRQSQYISRPSWYIRAHLQGVDSS